MGGTGFGLLSVAFEGQLLQGAVHCIQSPAHQALRGEIQCFLKCPHTEDADMIYSAALIVSDWTCQQRSHWEGLTTTGVCLLQRAMLSTLRSHLGLDVL